MLERMGIELQDRRDELRRIIMKLKLKSDMVKLKGLKRTFKIERAAPLSGYPMPADSCSG